MCKTEPHWRGVMRDLLTEYERNICTHDETHRGGSIWTICDMCGQKWADDEGGFVPYSPPVAVVEAEALIASPDDPASATGWRSIECVPVGEEVLVDGGLGLISLTPLGRRVAVIDDRADLYRSDDPKTLRGSSPTRWHRLPSLP